MVRFEQVKDVDDVLPGNVRGRVDDDREFGLPDFLVIALADSDRVHEVLIGGDRVEVTFRTVVFFSKSQRMKTRILETR